MEDLVNGEGIEVFVSKMKKLINVLYVLNHVKARAE